MILLRGDSETVLQGTLAMSIENAEVKFDRAEKERSAKTQTTTPTATSKAEEKIISKAMNYPITLVPSQHRGLSEWS